ncbi:uncharacterized protein G2W53_040718 [Senna tora]|uniref:Uncharacterized protein n=1 Tax=Senna tora TaxID=362788 RepID=A0A834VY68_9FABA|nr:uncharacterized protein G2W53_040718 [Senna tora]
MDTGKMRDGVEELPVAVDCP